MLFGRRLSDDVSRLVRDLGGDGSVAAVYDVRFLGTLTQAGGLVSQWDDVRGVGFGPSLLASGTARPTYSAAGLVFDGSANGLRAVGSTALGATPDDSILAVVGVMPAATNAAQRTFASLSVGAVSISIALVVAATATALRIARTSYTNTDDGTVTGLSGTRVIYGRHASSGVLGGRVGTGTETTTANTFATQVPNRLTVGANHNASLANFMDYTCKAVVVCRGGLEQQAILSEWARANHGATL